MLTSMRKRLAGAVLAVFALGFGSGQWFTHITAVSKANPGQMTKAVEDAVITFDNARKGAASAVQVSQAADETRVVLDFALVRQNDEIIRLLKKVAGEK